MVSLGLASENYYPHAKPMAVATPKMRRLAAKTQPRAGARSAGEAQKGAERQRADHQDTAREGGPRKASDVKDGSCSSNTGKARSPGTTKGWCLVSGRRAWEQTTRRQASASQY